MGGSRALAQGWALVAGQLGAAVPPTLGTLVLSPATGTVGQAYTGTITGATQGSTIVLDNMTVTGTGVTRTVTGTPSAAGTWGAAETLAGAVGSPKTTPGLFLVSAASAIISLADAAPRVQLLAASYHIETTPGTFTQPDSAYVDKLMASEANKDIPTPATTIPAGSKGYILFRLPATTANSPPLYVNWDGAASQPSVASPMLPTMWERTDLTGLAAGQTGTPGEGTYVQDTAFAPYRPNATSDASYTGRGHAYAHGVKPERIVQVRFDLTNAAITQSVTPHVICSSGQWMAIIGMSIRRLQLTAIQTINQARAQIKLNVPGSDPFLLVMARSGANQSAILSEQVTPLLNRADLNRHIRGIDIDPWVNDVAYAGVRPYETATQADRDAIRARSDSIISQLKTLNRVVTAPDLSMMNFTSADATTGAIPYVNGDFNSINGSGPWNRFVFGPAIKAGLPSSWDTALELPQVSDFAGIANKFDTHLSDSLHPNTAGYAEWRIRRAPLDRLLYGQAAGANTLQTLVTGLGASTTTALKTRLQAVFDAVYAMYPVDAGSTAATNRTTLRNQLDAIPAT